MSNYDKLVKHEIFPAESDIKSLFSFESNFRRFFRTTPAFPLTVEAT